MLSVWPVMTTLNTCLCAELGKPYDDVVEEPCFCGIVAGDRVNFEYVRPGGVMGWVRLVDTFPSTTFPQPDGETLTTCGTSLAYSIEVGIGRCAPIGTAKQPPSADDWFDLAHNQVLDLARIQNAITCCLQDLGILWMLGETTVVGPSGGFMATGWTVFVEGV